MAINVTSGYRWDPSQGPRYARIQVRYDEAKLQAVTAALQAMPGQLAQAVPAALNQSADEMKTWFYNQFAGRLSLKRKQGIKDRLTVTPRASVASWTSGVRIALTRLTVADFQTQASRLGVWWYPGDYGTWKLLPRSFLQSGYTHYLTGQYIEVAQVYRRAKQGEKGFEKGRPTRSGDIVRRYPIKVLRGPSLALVLTKDSGLVAQTEVHAEEVLTKKLLSQVDRFTMDLPK